MRRETTNTNMLRTTMKNFFIIFMSLTIGPSLFGQNIPTSFVNYETPEQNVENPIFDYVWDDKICEITLKSQTEFVFWSRPLYSSCLTWKEYNGTWKRINDTIVFSDQYEIIERDAMFEFANKTQNKFYHLNFKTDQDSKLTFKTIAIRYVYDFTSDLDNVKLNMELSNDFSLKIPFIDIPNRNELASIRYEYFLPNGKKRYGYITESDTVNTKENDLPNYIDITFIEQPKKEIVCRITKAVLIDDTIKIVSKEKTKSNLPDYSAEIEFKEVYEKRN